MAINSAQAYKASTLSFPEYFKHLSSGYSRSTGNSTYYLIEQALSEHPDAIAPSSTIHDNASGPGTATMAIIARLGGEPQLIEATDSVPAMIDVLSSNISSQRWTRTKASIMDSHDLKFPDDTFSTSITNFSIFTFKDPLKCIREVRRTLQPGGLALVSTWKRFTVAEIIHEAQLAVRPDAQLMKVPNSQFMQEGYLRNMMTEAGFADHDVQQSVVSATVKGEDMQGLRSFMLGGFTATARAGWTEEEQARWEGAINDAIESEKIENGGIELEAWIVVAKK